MSTTDQRMCWVLHCRHPGIQRHEKNPVGQHAVTHQGSGLSPLARGQVKVYQIWCINRPDRGTRHALPYMAMKPVLWGLYFTQAGTAASSATA